MQHLQPAVLLQALSWNDTARRLPKMRTRNAMLISLLAPALLLAADGACACACVLFLVVRRRRSRSLGVLGGAPRRRQTTAPLQDPTILILILTA